MLIQWSKIFAFVLLTVLVQLALIPNLGYPYALTSVVIVVLVFVGVLFDFRQAVVYGVVFGVIFDWFSPFFFMSTAVSFVLTYSVLRLIFNKFFTNKSFYVVMFLIVLATIFDHYLSNVLYFIHQILITNTVKPMVLSSSADFTQLGWSVVMNIIIGTAAFWLFYYSSNRFHSAVLGR